MKLKFNFKRWNHFCTYDTNYIALIFYSIIYLISVITLTLCFENFFGEALLISLGITLLFVFCEVITIPMITIFDYLFVSKLISDKLENITSGAKFRFASISFKSGETKYFILGKKKFLDYYRYIVFDMRNKNMVNFAYGEKFDPDDIEHNRGFKDIEEAKKYFINIKTLIEDSKQKQQEKDKKIRDKQVKKIKSLSFKF
jgi:hypothetical protein